MKNEVLKTLLVCFVLVSAIILMACQTIPKKISPVQNFNVQRYLGRWYEIARFDFRFEKNMNNVSAEYSTNPDGSIKVSNMGFDTKKQMWKQKTGRAKFVGTKDQGALKVSFFGPFYSDYTVIALDEDYSYSLVAGANKKLLWILSRTPNMPDEIIESYLQIAKQAGYDTSNLVWTIHDTIRN